MFDNLSDRFSDLFKKLRGHGTLSEQNIQEAMRSVRVALLEADVHLSVVRSFVERVRERAIGVEVIGSLTPGQQVIKVVHDELVELMGRANERLNLASQPPAVVLLVGLQGSGKTTTTAKLAKRLLEKERKKCLLASLDVYRPAAMDQLATVAKQVNADVLPAQPNSNPRDIARQALSTAQRGGYDVLLLDTAGRLHIDATLMTELVDIKRIVNPIEILLIADAMTGQDAVTVAQQFDQQLDITGVILTKSDGDARGGAALSIRHVTGKPIKFLGVGEKLDGLEPFHPDRLASRILGMGDVLTLVESAMENVKMADAIKMQETLTKGHFDLNDFLSQMQQIKKIGSIGDLVSMIPGMGQAVKGQDMTVVEKQMKRIEAMILSMTPGERRKPELLNASRKKRVARGSGTTVQDINMMLKQFTTTRDMMKRFGKLGKSGLKGLMRGGLGSLANMTGMGGLMGHPSGRK
ncbi:MAG: signal recognition particle protein [Magnetococcales bacterium]|nr:signal recognition particle protein [Magnetococcales bacterium]